MGFLKEPNHSFTHYLSIIALQHYSITMTANKSSRLVGIFLLFFTLLNFPIIGLFNKTMIIGGIPLLYLYLFLVWLIFIIFMFLIARKT